MTRERGRSEEEIAAAFFVSVGVARQRLRLAAVSKHLLDLHAEGPRRALPVGLYVAMPADSVARGDLLLVHLSR